MPRIVLGTPQEKELTTLVLGKLNEYGWADNEVLANFIVVMVANEKSKIDIIGELNDTSDFVDWLYTTIDGGAQATEPTQAEEQQQATLSLQQSQEISASAAEPDDVSMDASRQRPSPESRAPGRLLKSAISNATREEPAQRRQAPSRVYENEKRERNSPKSRERSLSPARSREGLSTRDERIRFRRTSRERAQDETRIDARLGNGRKDNDRMKGRLGGRIEDRLGTRGDVRVRSRERSWDRHSDYHDRRIDRNSQQNKNDRSGSRRRDALRDIERRLGTRPVNNFDHDSDENLPRQPASWSWNPEQMLRVEADITRRTVEAQTANVTRCRYWPNCAQGEMCQYWHPRELCTDFPNCSKTADTCLYIHPLAEPTAEQVAAAARQALMQSMRNSNNDSSGGNGDGSSTPKINALQMPFALGSSTSQDCKFGARCTRPDCKFRHPQKESNQQPCKFFPHCTKPNCPFFHPPYGEPLAQKDTTMDESEVNGEVANRLPTLCRYGDQCTRPGCHFTHPRDGPAATSTMPLCKFNPCTRPGCPFRHAPGQTPGVGHHKSLILNGGPKTSERFAGGVADASEVEKLHVPASAHWASGGISHQPDQSTHQHQQQQELDQATIQAMEEQAAAEMDMDMDVAI
ncbi:hypothetical protein BGZ54_006809 [Gamsiella multidivaricata]|nr:hypothetical protein BGZ54_006809 [Gamsiella multidivaricata]